MAKLKTKYWIEAGDIKTNLPKQHDTGMFRSLDDIIRDVLKCCGIDCCEGTYPGSGVGTNLGYIAFPTKGTITSSTGTNTDVPVVNAINAGLATTTMFINSHVPVTTVAGSVIIAQSGTDNQTLTADISGIDTATVGQVPSTDGAGNVVWITPTADVQNGLTEIITGEIEFGGTLIHDTTVSQDGYKLLFERNLLELTNTTKSILGLTDVNFVGEYTEDSVNFGPGKTAYLFNGVLVDAISGIITPIFGREIINGANYVRITQVVGDHELLSMSTDGTTTNAFSVSDGNSGVTASYNDGIESYSSATAGTGFIVSSSGNQSIIVDKTKIMSDNYKNTRDDSGVTTPINFLYTDSNGVFLSSPISSLPSQNIYNTDGTLTGNRTVDQNGNSLIINTAYAGSGLETHIEQSNNIAGIGGEGVGFWTENTDGYLSALYASGGIAVNSSQNATNTQFSRTINMAGIGYQFAGMSVSDGTTQNDFNVNTTDITVSQYPSTRDDSGITTPTNVLYTDASGKFLSAPVSSIVNADNGLTETLGNIQLGGTLLHDTTVTQDSNKLVFERLALELANTTKSILGLTNARFAGSYIEDTTNYGSGVTAYFFNGILRDDLGSWAATVNGNEITDGVNYTRITHMVNDSDVITLATNGVNSTTLEQSYDRWHCGAIGAGYGYNVELINGGLKFTNTINPSSYFFPTADGANGEVMMTNGSGVVSFEPTTSIVANEWHTTGNAGTDGGTTNFLGTTDAQDLVIKTNGQTIAQFSDNASQLSTGSIVFGTDDATYGTVSTVTGSNTVAFGQNNTVTGDICFVGGLNNTVSNNGNVCFGSGNIVSGLANSLCVGVDNIVSGDIATSLGGGNTIEATGGFACGNGGVLDNTAAYGCVFNTENTAKGQFSAAFGKNNTSYSLLEAVFGSLSTPYTPIGGTNIWQPLDRLFTIGNGTIARNNALTLWKDGRSMWNGDVAKTNTWIGVNGTNPQNFINVTTPTGALAAISTEHTPSGNYAVLGSNAGNSGLVINNTKQFSFTTTAGTTSTALGAITIVANYSNTGFLFGGGGVADSTVDINGTLGLSNTRISTANPILTTNNSVYHFTAGTTGTVDMTAMVVDNRTFVLTNYSGVSLTLSNAVRTGSATTTTTLTDNTSMTIAYDGVEFFKIA